MRVVQRFLVLLSVLACVLGCGGGSGSGGGAVDASNVPVFVTDAPGDYDHAWITVKQVDLIGKGGPVTVYQDAAGQTLDLAPLAGTTGQQFALLGIGKIALEHTLVIRVTIDEHVTLVPKGSSTGTTYSFAGSGSGVKVFTISAAGNDRRGVIADFDLANWSIAGGQVVATAKGGDPNKLGSDHHVHQHFTGTVSNLAGTAPNLTFDLLHGHDTLHITTTADTMISNEDGTPNPTIQNGSEVNVGGTFVPGTFSITAESLVIASHDHHQPVFAEGLVLTVGGDSFSLSPQEVEGFHPASSEIHVFTPGTTMFFQDGVSISSADFYAAIAHGSDVMIHGSYDAGTNTLTASSANLISHHDGDHHHHLSVTGAIDSLDAHAGTFNLTVQSWEGMEMHVGDVVHVVTSVHTTFDGVTLEHVANGDTLTVAGDLDGSTLTATLVKGAHHG